MKNIKIKDNVIKFNKTFEDTIEYANARCDEGDYVSALAALDFYAEKPRANSDVYAHVADVYTEIFNYDLAIKCWLEYLVKSPVKYYSDGFNGLGANYYMKGDKNRAAYYFKRQFCYEDAEGCVYNDILEEFAENEKQNFKPDIRLVLNDTDDEKSKLKEIRRLHEEHDFDKIPPVAQTLLESKNEKTRNEALYEIAYAEYACNRLKKARAAIDKLLEQGYKAGIKPHLLGAFICGALGYDKKAAEISVKTVDMFGDEDDAEKHITIVYDFVGKREACKLAKKYNDEFPYNGDIAYCCGVLKYNDGDYKGAAKSFSEAYYYSRHYAYRYYADLAIKAAEAGSAPDELTTLQIAPQLPLAEQSRMLEELSDIFEKDGLKRVSEKEFEYLLDWVSLEHEEALPLLAMLVCVDGTSKNKLSLKLKLTENMISEEVKRDIISVLCNHGETGKIAITVSGYLHFINVEMPEFQKRGQTVFKNAYAFALGVCALIAPEETDKLFFGALSMQDAIVRYCNVGNLKMFSPNEIACALCVYSKLDFCVSDIKALCNLFSVSELRVGDIVNLTEVRV